MAVAHTALTGRKRVLLGLGIGDLCVFIAYGALLAVLGPMHEPWRDEAQSWMLARDAPLPTLLFKYLRHEGHPALWYLILWVPAHLHLGYRFLWVISCLIAWAGIWVLLRYAPFPAYLKLLLPFTFFLAYQYSVVARSYVLFPLLCFLIALFYRDPRPRFVGFALLLGLLANVSIHGTLIALALMPLYWHRLRTTQAARPVRRDLWLGCAIFGCLLLFVAACLWPTMGALPALSPTLNRIVNKLSLPDPDGRAAAPPQNAPAPALPVNPPANPVPSATPAPPPASPPSVGLAKLRNTPTVLTYAFASWAPLALAFEGLVMVFLYRRGQLLLGIPLLLLAVFLVAVYAAPWHLGLLWVAFLMVLWMAWDTGPVPPRIQRWVAWSLALLCILQLPWTLHAFAFDATHLTSPDKAVADYVAALPPGTRIGGIGNAIAVEPYFDHNIYFNRHLTFNYMGSDPLNLTPEQTIAARPPVLIGDDIFQPLIRDAGYHELQHICGNLPMPGREAPDCLSINLAK